MKKIKQIQANGFYVFRGEVAANSNFIESINEAKQFLIYANFFLKDYLTVYEFVITRHEWCMIVRLKSASEICRVSKDFETATIDKKLVWRHVSERVRLFLSNYVRCVNRIRGRTGTLVHSSYERYCFETLAEAKKVINEIRLQKIRFYRRKKKYRGIKSHYNIPKKLGAGSIFLCSKDCKRKDKIERNSVESEYLYELRDLVLSKLVKNTIKLHFPQKSLKSHPKIE